MAEAQEVSQGAGVVLADNIDIGAFLGLRHQARQYLQVRDELEEMLESFDSKAGGLNDAALRKLALRWALGEKLEPKDLESQKRPLARMIQAFLHADGGEWDAALEACRAAEKAAPAEMVCVLSQAEYLRRKGDSQAALDFLESHRRDFSDFAEFSYQEGRALEELGRPEEASDRYQKAIDQNADHYNAVFAFARLLDQRGDDQAALDLYRRIGPGRGHAFVNASLNMALIYEDGGDYEKAMNCCRAVLAQYPTNRRAKLFLRDIEESMQMYYSPEEAKESERIEAVLRVPVSDFELSVRSRNCLNKMNIRTLGDLVRKSEQEMLGYKNFGETSLREIKEILSSRALRLGMIREDGSHAPFFERHHHQHAPAAHVPAPQPEQAESHLHHIPIDDLELSVRSRKCMERLGIQTIGQLMDLSDADLQAAKNFGRVSLQEIKAKLVERGLTLRA